MREAMKQCSIDGCAEPVKSWGWCMSHYYRWRRYGDPMGTPETHPQKDRPKCQHPRCDLPCFCKGWCGAHYGRVRKYGDPDYVPPKKPRKRQCSIAECERLRSGTSTLCGVHKGRRDRYGDPLWEPPKKPTTCRIANCKKPRSKGKSLCSMHRARLARYGDALHERPSCGVQGCDIIPKSAKYCKRHMDRFRKYGDPALSWKDIEKADKTCGIRGCFDGRKAWGLCGKHYRAERQKRAKLHGYDPDKARAILEEKAELNENGCMVWPIRDPKKGYGILTVDGFAWRAHRVAYELDHNVQLPPYTPVHHVCSNRSCVNPDHLQAVTPEENTAEMLERRYYRERIAELEAQLAELTQAA